MRRKRSRNRRTTKQFPGGPNRPRQKAGHGGWVRALVRRHAHDTLVRGTRKLQPHRGRGAQKPRQKRHEYLGKRPDFPQGTTADTVLTRPPLVVRRDRNRRQRRAARAARRSNR